MLHCELSSPNMKDIILFACKSLHFFLVAYQLLIYNNHYGQGRRLSLLSDANSHQRYDTRGNKFGQPSSNPNRIRGIWLFKEF